MKVEWNIDRFEISETALKRLRAVYPFFADELAKMEVWYLANPKKRKKNVFRFMTNWLNGVAEKKGLKIVGKYDSHNQDFKKQQAEREKNIAPPSSEWEELKKRLKR